MLECNESNNIDHDDVKDMNPLTNQIKPLTKSMLPLNYSDLRKDIKSKLKNAAPINLMPLKLHPSR